MIACATIPDSTLRAWRPLVDGTHRLAVQDALGRLLVDLVHNDGRAPSADLASGDSGLALLFAHLAELPDPPIDDGRGLARLFIDRALGALAHRRLSPALFGGWIGPAWVAQHIASSVFGAGHDPCQEIVLVLADQVRRSARNAHFDLISGLAGAAVFTLERDDERSQDILTDLVCALSHQSVAAVPGRTWRTDPHNLAPHARRRYPDGCFNVGVAHGVPGVVTVLARAHAAGIAGAGPLARAAAQWLWAQVQDDEVDSAMPSYFAPGDAPRASRLAWCYGDPGVAAALATAALALDDLDILDKALIIGRRAADRDPTTGKVGATGLCHGSAGLVVMFQRLWCISGDETFRIAARDWLIWTLEQLASGGAPTDIGFLDGRAGVALALSAAISDQEPTWTRALLIG